MDAIEGATSSTLGDASFEGGGDAEREITGWVLETIRLSRRKMGPIARALRTSAARMDAIADGDVSVITLERLYALGAMANREVPWEIVKAMAELQKARIAASSVGVERGRGRPRAGATKQFPPPSLRIQRSIAMQPDAALDVSGATVRDEIAAVIGVVEGLRSTQQQDRNQAALCARFGVEGGESTFEAVGRRFGVTRQRVEQMERRFLARVRDADGRWKATRIETLVGIAEASRAVPAMAVAMEHRSLLGGAGLKPALRLAGAMWPDRGALKVESVHRGRWSTTIVAGQEGGDADLLNRVLVVARALQAYAGACQVSDLYRALSSERPGKVTLEWLAQALDGTDGVAWLDGDRTWLTLPARSMSVLERRALTILSVAGEPVSLEVIHGGLTREPPSHNKSFAAQHTVMAPPRGIVASIFDASPRMTRSNGNLFQLAVEFNGLDELAGAERTLIKHVLAHGGVMAKLDMYGLTLGGGKPVTHNYLSMLLVRSSCLVRVARRVYAIRGRTLDPAALEAAFRKAGDVRPRADTDVFSIPVQDLTRKVNQSTICARRRDVPEGAAGEYRVDGTDAVCEVVDDVHGVRVKRIAGIKALLRAGGVGQRLVFDRAARTVRVEPLATGSTGGKETPNGHDA